MAFDSGGVTTGPITVPFIMALGVGVALTVGGRNASENSFGLIALCSIGPMIAVLVLALTSGSGNPIFVFYLLEKRIIIYRVDVINYKNIQNLYDYPF